MNRIVKWCCSYWMIRRILVIQAITKRILHRITTNCRNIRTRHFCLPVSNETASASVATHQYEKMKKRSFMLLGWKQLCNWTHKCCHRLDLLGFENCLCRISSLTSSLFVRWERIGSLYVLEVCVYETYAIHMQNIAICLVIY